MSLGIDITQNLPLCFLLWTCLFPRNSYASAVCVWNNILICYHISIILHCALLYPLNNEVVGGVYWFHSVRLSVRPSVRPSVCPACRVRSVTSTVPDGFFLYLAQMITIIRGCVACDIFSKSENLNFWQIFEIFLPWPWKKNLQFSMNSCHISHK